MGPYLFNISQQTLSSSFCMQPLPSTVPQSEPIAVSLPPAAALAKTQEWNDIVAKIEAKQDRILELQREVGTDGEALLNAEEDEIGIEPDEGDEDIFDAVAPMFEGDLANTRYQTESEIKALEEEITELEGQLEHETKS